MRILMISAEAPPLHRAGALVDVLDALPHELRERGHDTVAPDLPCDDDSAGLAEYADAVAAAAGDRTGLVVVADRWAASPPRSSATGCG